MSNIKNTYDLENFLWRYFINDENRKNIEKILNSSMISQCVFGFFKKMSHNEIFRFYLNIKKCNNKNQVICENKKYK